MKWVRNIFGMECGHLQKQPCDILYKFKVNIIKPCISFQVELSVYATPLCSYTSVVWGMLFTSSFEIESHRNIVKRQDLNWCLSTSPLQVYACVLFRLD